MNQSEEGEISSEEEKDLQNINQKSSVFKNKAIEKRKRKDKTPVFTSANYKRQKCQHFKRGNCLKGDDCTYRHDFMPDTNKKICKFYLSGACSKESCQYLHNTRIYPCRFYFIQNNCQQGINCRFSHDPIAPQFMNEYMKDNKDHILKLYRENRLQNQELVEYIKDDLPKKDVSPLPITTIPEQSNKQVVVKKDPRQRMVKQKTLSPTVSVQKSPITNRHPVDPRIKRQQKNQQKKEEENRQFYAHLKSFFDLYY